MTHSIYEPPCEHAISGYLEIMTPMVGQAIAKARATGRIQGNALGTPHGVFAFAVAATDDAWTATMIYPRTWDPAFEGTGKYIIENVGTEKDNPFLELQSELRACELYQQAEEKLKQIA